MKCCATSNSTKNNPVKTRNMEFTELKIIVQASGTYTEQELKDYLMFCMNGSASLSEDNPFINEESDVEIHNIDFT